jgi:hypothetical protein
VNEDVCCGADLAVIGMLGAVQTATVWRSPQGMIPIVPAAKSHYLSPARATQAGPMTTTASTKKISEALAEMSKLPLVIPTTTKLSFPLVNSGVPDHIPSSPHRGTFCHVNA